MSTAILSTARCTHRIQRLTCWPGSIARLVFATELARLERRTENAQHFLKKLEGRDGDATTTEQTPSDQGAKAE